MTININTPADMPAEESSTALTVWTIRQHLLDLQNLPADQVDIICKIISSASLNIIPKGVYQNQQVRAVERAV